MTETFLYLVTLLSFCFVGICLIATTEPGQKWRIDQRLIFLSILIGIAALVKMHLVVNYTYEPEMPSTMMTDTEVDRLLDEVRTDDKTIYFDDEFQILVYKYLLKYTREGKYETQNDPEMDDILRKVREEVIHDKGGTESTTVDDQSGL